jgi:AhpD family alkylhydroperoxidase
MARVRSLESAELAPDLAEIFEQFSGDYGPFRNQVAVFAHVPAVLRHLMPMLMELRAAATLPKRYLEIAIVVVSKLNACHYCVAHHKPFLAVEGISPEGIDRLLDPDNPELDAVDRLVVEYAQVAWRRRARFATACSLGCGSTSRRRRSSS